MKYIHDVKQYVFEREVDSLFPRLPKLKPFLCIFFIEVSLLKMRSPYILGDR